MVTSFFICLLSSAPSPYSALIMSASPLVSFNRAELRQLPLDVLLDHLLPLLANQQRQETETPVLDRWALEYADWLATHRRMKVPDLPGFTPMGLSWRAADVEEVPLEAFVMLGAATDMPFTVFRTLLDGEEDGSAIGRYVQAITCRRVFQGRAENHEQAEEERKAAME